MSRNLMQGTETDQPKLAILFIIAALTFLSFQDGLVKTANAFSSFWQFQSLRAMFNLTLILTGLAIAGQFQLLRPKNMFAVAMRTGSLMLTMFFFFAGSPFLTLSEMGAGLYTYPIFMSVLSFFFLGERIGPWRLTAIIIAAIGAILIVRPGATEFHISQILPICAGFTYAINATIVRRYCRAESPVTMAAWTGGGFLTISIIGAIVVASLPIAQETRDTWPFLFEAWPSLSMIVIYTAAVAAVCNVSGNILIVKAYQSAELSWLAPIDYAYLIFATFWGFVLFSDIPDALTVFGMAMIASAGILTAYRENRASKAAVSQTNH